MSAQAGQPRAGVRDRRTRTLEGLRLAYGAMLLARPDAVLHAVGVPTDPRSRLVARILGARHAVQAAVVLAAPGPLRLRSEVGSAIDALHASTALALAVLDPPRARAGLLDAAAASTWAVLGWRGARAD